MAASENETQYYHLDKIFIEDIVIDDTDKISLFGYLKDAVTLKLVRWTFFSDYNQLTDIMLEQGEKGNAVLQEMSRVLSGEYDTPTIVRITDACLHEYLEVSNLIFTTYIPYEPNMHGDIEPVYENAVLVTSVTPKEKFIRENGTLVFISTVKNGRLMVDLLDDALNQDAVPIYEQQLKDYLQLLIRSFEVYQGLVLKGFTEKRARKNAGLKNDMLFRIAFANYKIQQI